MKFLTMQKKVSNAIHNLNYWNSENWIGIGPGAYGRLWSSDQTSRIEYINYKNPKTWLYKNLHQTEYQKITKTKQLRVRCRHIDNGIKVI